MKRLALACFIGSLLIGCASDGPTSQEVGEQLQRGVRGEGQVTPEIDRSDDPYVKPRGGRAGAEPGTS